MLSRILSSFFYLALFLIIVAIAGGFWFSAFYTKEGPLREETTVTIARGSSIRQIAATLAKEQVVSDEMSFFLAARIKGRHTSLQAGEYRFTPHVSPKDVLDQLSDGKVVVRKVTVPEGLPVHQVIQILQETEGLEGTLPEHISEGSLMPDTYHFTKGDTRASMIEKMQEAMQNYVTNAWKDRAAGLPYESKQDALILASIVEKESGAAGEHARVAGVFINRLNKGIRLQTDPTVIYGLTEGTYIQDRKIRKSDLKDANNPYNTYVHAGLPPSPIANPGRKAIDAVMQPAETNELYFVADGEGGHRFATTLAEHNRNVRLFRKAQRESTD